MKSLGLKILFISILIVTLLIPIQLVNYLISERQERKMSMIDEVANIWGKKQTINEIIFYDKKNNAYRAEQISVRGKLAADIRYKGIFSIPLYTVDLEIDGLFPKLLRDRPNKIKFAMSDISAVQIKSFTIGGVSITNSIKQTANNTLYFTIPNKAGLKSNRFSLLCSIKGLDTLQFQPLADHTSITVQSNWSSPNFIGTRLPTSRQVTDKGFKASWIVQQYQAFQNAPFGISLFVPVDIYKLTDRSIKYALLFIFLTFLAFFLFEILNKNNIHLMQYLLVGLALTIFYLLLLALSEHIPFIYSYFTATACTITLISLYCKKILNNTNSSLIITGTLVLLYSFLLTLLMLEEYSLLLGSFGLFVILALVMYLTRNINWYKISQQSSNVKKSAE